MDSAKEIARDMLDAINVDGTGFLGAVAKGVISFPVSVAYLGYDFMDMEHRRDNQDDKFRLARLVKKGVFRRDIIEEIIKAGIEDFTSRINFEKTASLVKNITGSLIGKIAFTELTGVKLGEAIAARGAAAFLQAVWLDCCFLSGPKHPERYIHQEIWRAEILYFMTS